MSKSNWTFDQWMQQVNLAISNRLGGMTSDDLPDWYYRDSYDQGETPTQAARQAIAAAKEF
jgi:hypothetical protein